MSSVSLLEKIGSIRQKSSSVRHFVPYDRLLEILTEESVRSVISSIVGIREFERQLFVTLVRERFPRIFAILILNHHEQHLLKFLYRLEYDSRRYFSRNDLFFLPQEIGDAFFERQWEFIPVVLEKGTLHRELSSDYILPFLEDKKIGSGGFGDIFKIKLDPKCQLLVNVPIQQDSVYVVRKQISASSVAEQERAVLEVVRKLQHPNIIELLGSYTYQDNLNLLFPWAEPDLRALFRSGRRMAPDCVCSGIYGLADALKSIHNLIFISDGVESRQIGYHHDLRPANILLYGSTFLIADFGLAKLKKEDETSKSSLKGGHSDYLAPEAFDEIESENGNVGRALDVWAFGCIVAEFAAWIHGSDVEAFKQARKSTLHHGLRRDTDYAFHLNGTLKTAVKDWLTDLRSNPPIADADVDVNELINLSLQMLNPTWRTRIGIAPIVEEFGMLALRSKVRAIEHSFSNLVPGPGQASNRTQTMTLLEYTRFSAWFECYHLADNETKRTKLSNSLRVVEKLRLCLEATSGPAGADLNEAGTPNICADPELICEIVNELGMELPKHLRQEMDQRWIQGVLEVEDMVLEAVSSPDMPNRYRMVGIKAAMRYLSVAISRSIRLREVKMLVDSGVFEHDEHSNEWPDRIMGYVDDTRAILEYIAYDREWKEDRGDAMLNRIEALARFLNTDDTPRVGVLIEKVLNCLGYFHDRSTKQFGMIYATPTPELDGQVSQCFSLNAIIRYKEDLQAPWLGDVFSMASGIVQTVAALHEVGWLHKGISSENVLIFSPNRKETHRHVASAVLGGFSYSRPESKVKMSIGPNNVSAYYLHPKYIPRGAPFERKYDFFGVGVVLLEIGLWCNMYQLFDMGEISFPGGDEVLAEENRVILLEKYVPQLGERMGIWYQEAVAFCLDVDVKLGSPADDANGRLTTQEAFQLNVVARLARCSA